ncbi:MAG: guanylate kinase [Bilifractor sp.]|nr:guanylate kinase [Lachnospiraceae bacterium]MDY2837200.1 guanylate kinase [Bilifractor sp.]
MSRIFYIMGKSASGKDHIYKALLSRRKLSLKPIVLYTTRPMRRGEENGREYFFSDEKHLEELRKAGRIIEERCYQTISGPWYYFTADEGQIDLNKNDYLGIGTLESYSQMVRYYGRDVMVPIYIEVDDGIRLERALKRERKQRPPRYEEMCRRFLADQMDFSEEKIVRAGISRRFENNGTIRTCIDEITAFIRSTGK